MEDLAEYDVICGWSLKLFSIFNNLARRDPVHVVLVQIRDILASSGKVRGGGTFFRASLS